MTNVPDQEECPRLSLGIDSTLKNWRDLTISVFGAHSAAVAFWDAKIAEQGEDTWVLADEQQTLALVANIHRKDVQAEAEAKARLLGEMDRNGVGAWGNVTS